MLSTIRQESNPSMLKEPLAISEGTLGFPRTLAEKGWWGLEKMFVIILMYQVGQYSYACRRLHLPKMIYTPPNYLDSLGAH